MNIDQHISTRTRKTAAHHPNLTVKMWIAMGGLLLMFGLGLFLRTGLFRLPLAPMMALLALDVLKDGPTSSYKQNH